MLYNQLSAYVVIFLIFLKGTIKDYIVPICPKTLRSALKKAKINEKDQPKWTGLFPICIYVAFNSTSFIKK
jgi:hypothetical protein